MAAKILWQCQMDRVTQSSPSPGISFIHKAPHAAEVSHISAPTPAYGQSRSSFNESFSSNVLKDLHISAQLLEDFLELARENTTKDLETCGVLGAFLKDGTFYVTTLILPKQESTSSSCQAVNEEEIFAIQNEQSLFPVGWIHTHPSQSCFMSSIDLHTQFSYQVMVPEAVAIVMAPTDKSKSPMMIQCVLVIILSLSAGFGFVKEVESFGINYGQVGNNLPTPDKVLELFRSLKITKTRIYDTNPQILTAFGNSSVEIIVTVENDMLGVLIDPQQSLQWVNTHIKPFISATRITGIAVGNEVFTGDDTSVLVENLVPAMVSLHAALVQLGLDQYVKVSTPSSLAVLSNSYPPSAGCFQTELNGIMTQFLQFLSSTKAPFWINAYPYFAYKDDPTRIPLDYALFNPNSGMVDPYTKLPYDNMLYAQVDAVIFAMARLGFQGIEVRVSETGWPSKGDANEVGATPLNAAIYNRNLLKRQFGGEGTPLRPKSRLEIYLFALFNEDMKPGPTSERNYGLYQPDGSMAYNVGLVALSTATTTTSPTSSASSSISLASSATKVEKKIGYESLVYWMFVYLLAFQLYMTRQF